MVQAVPTQLLVLTAFFSFLSPLASLGVTAVVQPHNEPTWEADLVEK